jgi:hypothetical protein
MCMFTSGPGGTPPNVALPQINTIYPWKQVHPQCLIRLKLTGMESDNPCILTNFLGISYDREILRMRSVRLATMLPVMFLSWHNDSVYG